VPTATRRASPLLALGNDALRDRMTPSAPPRPAAGQTSQRRARSVPRGSFGIRERVVRRRSAPSEARHRSCALQGKSGQLPVSEGAACRHHPVVVPATSSRASVSSKPKDDGAAGRRRVALRARGGDGACSIRGHEAPRVLDTRTSAHCSAVVTRFEGAATWLMPQRSSIPSRDLRDAGAARAWRAARLESSRCGRAIWGDEPSRAGISGVAGAEE
jgi:hypothetical protein